MTIQLNQLIRSKRRTMALVVKPDGSLVVRAPWHASAKSIHQFVEEHAKWIKKQRAEAQDSLRSTRNGYVAGETFLYLGTAYPLEIVRDQEKDLILEEEFRLAESAQSRAEVAFEQWYREQAREVLSDRVQFYADQHNFLYKKVGITSARTRWGSCSITGSLNFSWRLIMTPMEVVDYVVIHELVHTIVHNHSNRFWRKVAMILPNYEEHRKWLRKEGRRLLT
jgi:predicted metal-dependent hydrolase